MTVYRAAHIAAALTLAPLIARADAPPAPPEGWEAPAPPAPPAPRPKGKAAACCAHDQACCIAQSLVDAARPMTVLRTLTCSARDLPASTLKVGDDVEGAPDVRAVDGLGRPFPWGDGPKIEVRVVPPGLLGEVTFRGHTVPFFFEPRLRSMGFGMVNHLSVGADSADAALRGKVSYVALDRGENGAVTVDRAEGSLAGSTKVKATRYEHAVAAPIIEGVLHGYRTTTAEGEALVLLLPEVVLGIKTRDVASEGGFYAVRGAVQQAYTAYTLPIGPTSSGMAVFTLLHSQIRRYLYPDAAAAQPETATLVISASRTSAEAEPRVTVTVLR